MNTIIESNYKYKRDKYIQELKIFKFENLFHLLNMYSIIEKYDLPLDFDTFIEYCYRNHINPRLV